MPFLTSRGGGPSAASIMSQAYRQGEEYMEAQMQGAIVTKPSIAQEGFFAPRSWVDEIDRPAESLGRIHMLASSRIPRVRIAKPSPRRGRSWDRLYREVRPVPAKGYPVAARKVAAAAVARAIAEREKRVVERRIRRGREREREREESRREWRRRRREAVARARAAHRKKMAWWRSLDPEVRKTFKKRGLKPVYRRGRIYVMRPRHPMITIPGKPSTRGRPVKPSPPGRRRRPFGSSPGLGTVQLGQGNANQSRHDATLAATLIVKAVTGGRLQGGLLGEVEGVTAANWDVRVPNLQKHVGALIADYRDNVHGKTGNATLERKVSGLLVTLNRKILDVAEKPPSFWQESAAKIDRFLNDFIVGVKSTVKSFSEWALRQAEPIVKKYHQSMVRVAELEKNLDDVTKEGKRDAKTLLDQGRKIGDVKSRQEWIRTFVSEVTGADIDSIAQEQFGSYPSLGAAPGFVIPVKVAITLIIVGGVVAVTLTAAVAISFLGPVGKAIATQIVPIAVILGIAYVGAQALAPRKKRA